MSGGRNRTSHDAASPHPPCGGTARANIPTLGHGWTSQPATISPWIAITPFLLQFKLSC